MAEFIPNGQLIKQLHNSLERQANNELRSNGLTLMQVSVLLALQEAEKKQLSMKELERHFQIAQSTVVGIISRLEHKGYVKSLGDCNDRRVKIVHITDTGELCCEKAATHMQKAEEQLTCGFSMEEREMFNALLTKAAENVR